MASGERFVEAYGMARLRLFGLARKTEVEGGCGEEALEIKLAESNRRHMKHVGRARIHNTWTDHSISHPKILLPSLWLGFSTPAGRPAQLY
jgi:hypothetical protein